MTSDRLKRCYGFQRARNDLEQAFDFARNASKTLQERAEDPQHADEAQDLAEQLLELKEKVDKQLQKEEEAF